MNRDYLCANNRVYISTEDGLMERSDFPTEEQAKLENEIEILEQLLEETEEEYSKVDHIKKPMNFFFKLLLWITFLILANTIITHYLLGLATEDLEIVFSFLFTFELPFASLLFCYSRWQESTSYKQKCRLAEQCSYLREETSKKKEKRNDLARETKEKSLKDTPIIHLSKTAEAFTEDEKRRLDLIAFLGEYKEELIKHYQNGTLDEFLMSHDATQAEKRTLTALVEKTITMQPKETA